MYPVLRSRVLLHPKGMTAARFNREAEKDRAGDRVLCPGPRCSLFSSGMETLLVKKAVGPRILIDAPNRPSLACGRDLCRSSHFGCLDIELATVSPKVLAARYTSEDVVNSMDVWAM